MTPHHRAVVVAATAIVLLLSLSACQIFKTQDQDAVPVIDGEPLPPTAQNAAQEPLADESGLDNPSRCDYPVTTKGAQIVCVIDGDTVRMADGSRIRLIGIDAPERGSYGFANASFLLANLTNGTYIYLEKEKSETDRYGRLLRNIFANEFFANQIIVEEGWATAWAVPPDTQHATVLRQAEEEAKAKKRGIWAQT